MDMTGYSNTQKILNAGDASIFPAAYTVDFANGWYVPAVGQLRLLFSEIITLNNVLQTVNGTPFQMDNFFQYWSSTEYGQAQMWNVNNTGNVTHHNKNFYFGVRSVRDF
jgi:hypothetical protein